MSEDLFQKPNTYSAKWKIELRLQGRRSAKRPFPGTMSVWESGKKLNGDGDLRAYWCMKCGGVFQPSESNGCGNVISGDNIQKGVAHCTSCGRLWESEELTGDRAFCLPYEKWAVVLEKEFLRLGSDADIYLKYHRQDPRPVASGSADEIMKRRNNAVSVVFPLHGILQAHLEGNTPLVTLFKAFLKS